MMIAYYKRFGRLANNNNILAIGKILASSTIMVIVATTTFNYFNNKISLVPSLLISIILSGIIYLICILLAKIDVVDGLKNELLSKIEVKNKR